mmetsp:Transcript_14392/g.32892  ORF Transcript_14392/g.32892 Transcript_14392/m.32892 type:complete len:265 (-) Transcript_14392:178-972(-)|eukprot:CAMPEP_0119368356 /NCGR_PEP_ID=MMETSP1334-20130426/15025_1 /TAXON_ID=127549 /ORGANISM="Calcidiscus leptoporus, Strain RCC1130" /LENGTH=264 /DNA_ID=CAMNT_0007384981 /DNA_START=17 /DNA_END=811 /DNA_ORIENTATION=-
MAAEKVDDALATVARNLQSVHQRMQEASAAAALSSCSLSCPPTSAASNGAGDKPGGPVTLIAVSKLKPASYLTAAYNAGQRHFGENYVQELVAKARELPDDIAWHFIGHLQTNKVKELVSVPNLLCVHTVDSRKLAAELQKRAAQVRPDRPLPIMVQVNTSGEESKSGCAPADCSALCKEVWEECPGLTLCGLMCIGKYSAEEGGAEADFSCLASCRERAAELLGIEPARLALSMGMSHDFEAAIVSGATHVRVGSTIFGARKA